MMSKRWRQFLLIVSLPLLLAAKSTPPFKIKGVNGKLQDNIETRLNELGENRDLNTEPTDELIGQISKAMYPYGYFKPSIQITHTKKNLIITIEKGPRLLINQLTIKIIGEGKNNAEIQQALKQLQIQPAQPFNSEKYEAAKQTLFSAAEHQGYLHSSFIKSKILIDKQHYTTNIQWIFDTGPQYYFGQVQFDPTYISPDLLKRFIPFQYGQPYSTDQVLAFNNTLLASGYFRAVSIKQQPTDATLIPLDVHLQQAPRHSYSFGVGFGTDTGLRGSAAYHLAPVNRAGHKFNVIAQGSFKENALQTQYIIPGKNPSVDQFELLSGFTNLHYNSGNSNALSFSAGQRHNLPSFQRVLSINGLYEGFNYTNEPKMEKLTFYPKASLTWKNPSQELFVPNGYRLTLNGLVANRAILSEVNFSQVSVDAKAAVTIPQARTRLYLHALQGATQIKDVNQLPLSLALFLGGSDNLKGYSFNSIGPGKLISYGGFELQKETAHNIYLTGFIDIGSVHNPDPIEWHRDIGFGLMWVSPVGPIKVGIAQPVDKHFNRTHRSSPRLVINMGPDL